MMSLKFRKHAKNKIHSKMRIIYFLVPYSIRYANEELNKINKF